MKEAQITNPNYLLNRANGSIDGRKVIFTQR